MKKGELGRDYSWYVVALNKSSYLGKDMAAVTRLDAAQIYTSINDAFDAVQKVGGYIKGVWPFSYKLSQDAVAELTYAEAHKPLDLTMEVVKPLDNPDLEEFLRQDRLGQVIEVANLLLDEQAKVLRKDQAKPL